MRRHYAAYQRIERLTAILFKININYARLLRVGQHEKNALVGIFSRIGLGLRHEVTASGGVRFNWYRSASSLLQHDQRIKHALQNVGKRRFLCVHVILPLYSSNELSSPLSLEFGLQQLSVLANSWPYKLLP